jgi:sugar/nucleoside kinase (ribokinase family)
MKRDTASRLEAQELQSMLSKLGPHMYDLVVVGHLTMDVNVVRGRRLVELGGPPAYAMCTPALGLWRVGIVSRVGDDFPPSYFKRLVESGLDLTGLQRGRETTHFLNRYDDEGHRTQEVTAVAESICLDDIPPMFRRARWVHVSPVLQEVDPTVIAAAKQHHARVSVDVQGFVRRIKPNDPKRVEACSWKEFSRVAGYIDVLKCDVDEIRQLTGQSDIAEAALSAQKAGSKLVLVTDATRGSHLACEGTIYRVPAIPPRKTVDHTGSGDVYAMSFLVEFERTGRPLWSAYFAAASASFNIESPGATGFPTHDQVTGRLDAYLARPERGGDAAALDNEESASSHRRLRASRSEDS